MGKDPVDGIAYEGVKKKSYEMFTDDDLGNLFTAPEFLAQRIGKYPGRYWLILILLHSGARREEIAQLSVDDVKKQDGIPYCDLTAAEADGKRLKNVKPSSGSHSLCTNQAGLLRFPQAAKRGRINASVPTFPEGQRTRHTRGGCRKVVSSPST